MAGKLEQLYEKFGDKVLAELQQGPRTKQEIAKAVRGLSEENVYDVIWRLKHRGGHVIAPDRKTGAYVLGKGKFVPKPKTEKPKAVEPEATIEVPDAVEVPEAAAAGVDAAYAEAEKSRRKSRTNGQPAGAAKAIATNREPVGESA